MAVPGAPFSSVGVSDGIMDPPSASPLFYPDSVTPPFSPSHHLRSPPRRPCWLHPHYSPLSTLMGKVATKLDQPADRQPGFPPPRLPILPPHKTTMVSDKELGATLVEDATQPLLAIVGAVLRRHGGLYSVYVHTTLAYKLIVSETSAFHNSQIPSKVFVEMPLLFVLLSERRILSNALLDFSNECFMLLSESCIPLFNFSVIYRYLIGSEHNFIESYDLDDKDVRGRYNPKMDPNITVEQWRKGYAWFELSRDMSVSLVVDSKYYSLFKEYCNLSPCFPDEHYIPTLMNMFNGAKEANRTVTWTDWSRRGPHPVRFGQESITKSFIQSIRNSNNTCLYNSEPTSVCFLFARKFAPSALEPLLNLTSTVMHY